jgi:hypothetical protein
LRSFLKKTWLGFHSDGLVPEFRGVPLLSLKRLLLADQLRSEESIGSFNLQTNLDPIIRYFMALKGKNQPEYGSARKLLAGIDLKVSLE